LEIPPFLAAAGQGRAVSKAVVHAVLSMDATWTELCLSRDDGWLSPRQVAPSGTDLFTQHQLVRVCVVMPLQSTWEQTRSGLKRNVKESVRRSQNRLAKDGRPWQIHHRRAGEVDAAAVRRLLDLHRARSAHTKTRQRHPDAYADPATNAFIHDVLPRLARAGEASLVELELAGRVVATQLLLHPPDGVYFHSSGFLPQEWALGPVTTLQTAAMQDAIGTGRRWVNFSPGPSESKSRWSDQLAVYDDTAFGRKEHAGQTRYAGFFVARSLRELYRRRPAKPESGPEQSESAPR
jgi:CelD/BcsL family acetyltransferase involved in cellulose biosynthesis